MTETIIGWHEIEWIYHIAAWCLWYQILFWSLKLLKHLEIFIHPRLVLRADLTHHKNLEVRLHFDCQKRFLFYFTRCDGAKGLGVFYCARDVLLHLAIFCALLFPGYNHHSSIYYKVCVRHYCDAIMSAMAFQLTSLTIVYPAVYSGAEQSSASLAFVPVNSPHK